MIRPDVLASERPYGPWGVRGSDLWETFLAAETGDVRALRRLLGKDPNLARTEYWYTPPLRIAVREGHAEAARVLRDAGGEPASLIGQDDLVTVARERGHEDVARLVEEFRALPARVAGAGNDPPVSAGAAAGTALHAAAREGDGALVEALLAQGADPNFHVDSAGSATYAAKTPEIRALLSAHGGRLDAFDLVWLGEDDEVVRRVAADPGERTAAAAGFSRPPASWGSATSSSGSSTPARGCLPS